MDIEVKRYTLMGADGDRATCRTPYHKWIISLCGFELVVFDEYDNFHCHIDHSGTVEADMQSYAYGLCAVLKVPVPPIQRMVKKIVQREDWVPENEQTTT